MMERRWIISNDIGRGVKAVDKDGKITRESFLCWNCRKPFSKEEVKKYKNLKGKILTSKMVCSECNKKYKIHNY